VGSSCSTWGDSLGTYDVIVRAYDSALNYREETQHLAIVTPALQFVGPEGVVVGQTVVAWPWVLLGFLIIIAAILFPQIASMDQAKRIVEIYSTEQGGSSLFIEVYPSGPIALIPPPGETCRQ
jgi:hypothetical protein